MPELPEVENVVRGLRSLVGRKVTKAWTSDHKRFSAACTFEDNKIVGIRRVGKHILFDLQGCYSGFSRVLENHLGMTGTWRVGRDYESNKHDQVMVLLEDESYAVYNDPRKFGAFRILDDESKFDRLGVDGLEVMEHLDDLKRKMLSSKVVAKDWLMDQSNVAGLGNIYASETLWRGGIHPEERVRYLAENFLWLNLLVPISPLLQEAISHGGSSISDFVGTDGEKGGHQSFLDVYGRAGSPCNMPGCTGTVEKIVQKKRSTFYCRTCQPRLG